MRQGEAFLYWIAWHGCVDDVWGGEMRVVDIFRRRGALYMILSCLGMQPERDNIVLVVLQEVDV